jgi:hypothetical protein
VTSNEHQIAVPINKIMFQCQPRNEIFDNKKEFANHVTESCNRSSNYVDDNVSLKQERTEKTKKDNDIEPMLPKMLLTKRS